MSATKMEMELRMGIMGTGLLQPVESSTGKGHLEVLSKVVPGQEKAWVALLDNVLELTEGGVDLHVCRRYLRKKGRTVFGWHLAITAKNAKKLQEALDAVLAVLARAQPELAPEEPQEALAAVLGAPARTPRVGTLRPGQHPPPQPGIPRAPGAPGGFGEEPENFVPTIRVVKKGVDAQGRPTSIEEMPLPHVYRELNKPAHKFGKGAKGINTGGGNG
jgi:hypothetical protein